MPLAGHGLRPAALRRRAGRPQLKRDPLGRTRGQECDEECNHCRRRCAAWAGVGKATPRYQPITDRIPGTRTDRSGAGDNRIRSRSNSVETTIHVFPAVGHGYRGGLATADIIVTVDGKKRIDCPYDSGPVELADIGVSPVDGRISVSGSYDDKRIERFVFLNDGQTIDRPWLQRNAK